MVEKATPMKRQAKKPKKPKEPEAPKPPELVEESSESSENETEEDEGGDERSIATGVTYKYQLPAGFGPVPIESLPDSNPFSAANLKGKHLWFITAPSGANLSKLNVIDSSDIAKGKPVLESKNGRKYCMTVDENSAEMSAGVSVLVPDSKGIYRGTGQPVSKLFTFVEDLPIPSQISGDSIPTTKPIRLQPDGLRMRYKPFGADGETGHVDRVTVGAMDVDHAEERSPERRKKRQKTDGGREKKKKHRSKDKEKRRSKLAVA